MDHQDDYVHSDAGYAGEIQTAKQFLQNFTHLPEPTIVVDRINVNCKFYPHIIGKNGTRKLTIQKNTSTAICFPPGADARKGAGEAVPPDVIVIVGSPSGVASAKQMISQIVHEAETLYTKTIKINKIWHSRIRRAMSEKLKETRDRLGLIQVIRLSDSQYI